MDRKRTREYYERLRPEDLCGCAYCRNYRERIRSEYPALSEFLQGLGIDPGKPFETLPLEPENGYLEYIAAQYVVYGDERAFQKTTVDPVDVDIARCHPSSGIDEPHFILEVSPIRLKWGV